LRQQGVDVPPRELEPVSQLEGIRRSRAPPPRLSLDSSRGAWLRRGSLKRCLGYIKMVLVIGWDRSLYYLILLLLSALNRILIFELLLFSRVDNEDYWGEQAQAQFEFTLIALQALVILHQVQLCTSTSEGPLYSK
jgi:hypothetical protein